MLSFRAPAAAVLALFVLWPGLVLGQEKAGVVTTLEGNVTAARPAIAQPIALKFKDDVYLNDRITTGDRSLARMLLGGKAIVTVRERSVITITEIPGKSTIELASGKIGLAVAKERMRPGESIEIKTPNAVCAVRGTVVVAEVQRATAQAGGSASTAVTHFWVLRGIVQAFLLLPGTGLPSGSGFQVGTLQGFTTAGGAPPTVGNINPGDLGQITGGLTPSGVQQSGGGQDGIISQQVQTAVVLADILVPNVGPLVDTNTNLCTGITCSGGTGGSNTPTTTTINLLPGQTLATLESKTYDQTVVTLQSGTTVVPGQSGDTLLLVPSETNATLNASLLDATSSTINPGPSGDSPPVSDITMLKVEAGGTLTSNSTTGLISIDPSEVNVGTFADIRGTLMLSGSLLTDQGGLYSVTGDFVKVAGEGGGLLKGSSESALLSFSGSTVAAGTMFHLSGDPNRKVRTGTEDTPIGSPAPVGKDQPLQYGAVLLEGTNGSRIAVGQVVQIDTALLAASAPVVRLLNSAMAVQNDAINLISKVDGSVGSQFKATGDAVFRLDNSTLQIVSGSLARISNSVMNINGYLFRLDNGSALSILNGALVTINGNSLFKLTGSFGLFGTTGTNTLNISATLTAGSVSPTLIGGIPVILLNGAQASQVTVASDFKPFVTTAGASVPIVATGGNANIASGAAALVVDGKKAFVNLSPAK